MTGIKTRSIVPLIHVDLADRKKGAKASVKKTTWVKIKVVKAATPDEPVPSVTPNLKGKKIVPF